MERIKNIDALRGISVSMIVMLHILALSNLPNSKLLNISIQTLSYGVPFFFVISGYVISLTSKDLFNGQTLQNYIVKRASKIIPLYFLFLTIWLTVFYISNQNGMALPRNSPNELNVTFSNFLIHVFFLQGFFPSSLNSLLDGDWSIVNEVYFYILFPFLHLYAKNSLKKLLKVFFLSLLISLIFSLLNRAFLIGNEFSYYGFLNHFPMFVMGMIGFHLSKNDLTNSFISENRFLLLFIIFILSIGSISFEGKIFGPEYIFSVLFLLTILVIGSFQEMNSLSITTFLAFIGKQSYSIYFTHLLLIKLTVSLYPMIYLILPISLLQANIFTGILLTILFSNLIFNKIDNYFVNKFRM
tara:strand:+ start:6238 stop:7305 length:1068 start_codon:yes stop_codon:yes gene_type:complete